MRSKKKSKLYQRRVINRSLRATFPKVSILLIGFKVKYVLYLVFSTTVNQEVAGVVCRPTKELAKRRTTQSSIAHFKTDCKVKKSEHDQLHVNRHHKQPQLRFY